MFRTELTSGIYQPVNRAFSKQAVMYDFNDRQNIVLQDMRLQVYKHVSKFIKTQCHILELNAGTGIDAAYFAQHGCTVHATDLSDGMLDQIRNKIRNYSLQERLTCQQLSYDELDKLGDKKFDYVFSNFGGLNCIDDLKKITRNIHVILNPGAHVTFVIMPPVCLWELLSILKGNGSRAFRRFSKKGVMAHLEGEYFRTYYHSLNDIKKAFDSSFEFVKSEGLCALSPPPSRGDFPLRHPKFYTFLRKIDSKARTLPPFNRWADHIIVTFKLRSLQNQ